MKHGEQKRAKARGAARPRPAGAKAPAPRERNAPAADSEVSFEEEKAEYSAVPVSAIQSARLEPPASGEGGKG